MDIITLKVVAAAVGRTERRVRQVVDQLKIGTAINPRMIVLDKREYARVKNHFAEISKKSAQQA